MWIYNTEAKWALILECKLIASLEKSQLVRHASTARAHGFGGVHLLLITPHEFNPGVLTNQPDSVTASWARWSDIFEFFHRHGRNNLESEFVKYMRILETQMIADGHEVPPLTKFSGIPFGPNYPYSEREAKVVLRALMAELRPRLAVSRVLPKIDQTLRRQAMATAWDIIGFDFASREKSTKHPHLAVVLTRSLSDWKQRDAVWIQLVLPHNARREYWKRIRHVSKEQFGNALTAVSDRIRQLRRRVERGIWEPKLTLDIAQRHFYAQKEWTRDGLIHFDMDAIHHKRRKIAADVKNIPAWLDAAHLIVKQSRRANFELALQVRFPLSDRNGLSTSSWAVACSLRRFN